MFMYEMLIERLEEEIKKDDKDINQKNDWYRNAIINLKKLKMKFDMFLINPYSYKKNGELVMMNKHDYLVLVKIKELIKVEYFRELNINENILQSEID